MALSIEVNLPGSEALTICFWHLKNSCLQIDDVMELTYTSAVKEKLAMCFLFKSNTYTILGAF